MTVDDLVPSTPDPQIQTLVYTAIRAALQILGTFGVTWGLTVSAAQWQIVSGALAVLIGLGWAFWQKIQAARAAHAAALLSASVGAPVQPVAAKPG